MSSTLSVLELLEQKVPLTLLFDLAGFAPTSEELYHSEVCTVLCTCSALSEAS